MDPTTLCPEVVRFSPYAEHFFFGYYDLQPWDSTGRRHLAHRVEFIDRIPRADDAATVGYFEWDEPIAAGFHYPVPRPVFRSVGRTHAWNFQQGSMLQWNPARPDREVIFNVRDGNRARAVIVDVETGAERKLLRPVASVNPDGKTALSVSFARMFSFRPGYGYAGVPDPFAEKTVPEDDGVFSVDLETGAARLLISTRALWNAARSGAEAGDHKALVNHITWNTDGTRFVVLLRYMRKKGWHTAVLVVEPSTGEVNVVIPFGYASHYWWVDADMLLFHSDGPDGVGLYRIDLRSETFTLVEPELFSFDGHCSATRDGRFIVYDSYPTEAGFRRMFTYDTRDRSDLAIGAFHSPAKITGDIRCDLHPRLNRDGSIISFDSAHEGFRGMYLTRGPL